MKRKPPTTDAPHRSDSPQYGMPVEWLDLPDEQLGYHVLAMWFAQLCTSKGIAVSDLDEAVAEAMRRAALQEMDARVDLVPLEKAIRLVAQGDPARGGKLFREFMHHGALHMAALDEAATGRRKQREKASRPRPDELTELIAAYLKKHPNATEDEVRSHLEWQRENRATEFIDDIDKSGIHYVGRGKAKEMRWTGLKHRISRARAKNNESR